MSQGSEAEFVMERLLESMARYIRGRADPARDGDGGGGGGDAAGGVVQRRVKRAEYDDDDDDGGDDVGARDGLLRTAASSGSGATATADETARQADMSCLGHRTGLRCKPDTRTGDTTTDKKERTGDGPGDVGTFITVDARPPGAKRGSQHRPTACPIQQARQDASFAALAEFRCASWVLSAARDMRADERRRGRAGALDASTASKRHAPRPRGMYIS
nr:hypothetical protein CFP56_79259 [Quercus suber]